ncbi:MAG: hypothetical protein V3V16_13265 [Melioribacteraceae bacterium]
MKYNFEQYKSRKIEFQKLVTIVDWQIKIYSITNKKVFSSHQVIESVLKTIPKWFPQKPMLQNYKIGFLIVHEGREGVWLLFNWWQDGEMIETKVYFSDYEEPTQIKVTPLKSHSIVCVWELEVIIYERKVWIEHVLLHANNPDFEKYLGDVLT